MVGNGFDFKNCFAPPPLLLGLFLCPWMWHIFFVGIQHSPVDGSSAVSYNFGVLAGEDKHMSFYSTNAFLDTTLKSQYIKEIIDKLGFIKIEKFCSVKDNEKRMRRQVTDREKIFAKDTSDKGLLSKIDEEPLKLNDKKTNNLI